MADQKEFAELDFLERVAIRLPDDEAVLKALADLYTKVGLYEKGLELDRKLVRLCAPEPLVWYNLACSLALLNRRAEAMEALAQAVRLGYRDYQWMSEDTDLRSLQNEQAFKALLQQIAARSSKTEKHGGTP